MHIKLKEHKTYIRQVLDAVQAELGRMDIGIEGNNLGFTLTEMDGSPLALTKSQEARIKALQIIKEKLE